MLLLLATVLNAPGILAADGAPKSLFAVGVTRRAFTDPERTNWPRTGPRPVRVTCWYPCEDGPAGVMVDDSGTPLSVLPDAKISSALSKYPLVMISPGSGGNASGMLWLGHYLARHGYVSAALDHNGTAEEELHLSPLTPTDFFGWERARDVSVALTHLLEDPQFAERIERTRIGAAGFSLGATTMLWTAGARLDLQALRAMSPPPPPSMSRCIEQLARFSQEDVGGRQSIDRANRSYRDPRITAVFALAPPMGVGFPADGLRDIHVPVCIAVGDADVIAPAATNARHFAESIPGAHYVVLPGERGHYLKPISPEQRHAELTEVAELALRLFEKR